jgi:hypothetical protein
MESLPAPAADSQRAQLPEERPGHDPHAASCASASPLTIRERLAIAALVIGSLGLHVWYTWRQCHGALDTLIYPDEKTYYLEAAQRILGDGLAFFTTPRALWNGPLDPLWIALWQANVVAVKLANIALVSLAGVLVWDLARAVASPAAALLALALYALYPPLYEFGGTLLTEPLFIALLILALWLLVRRPSPRWAGVILGLATLTRPTIQLLPPLLLALVWIPLGRRSEERTRTRRQVTMLFLGWSLVVLPYLAHNVLRFHTPRIANGFGAVLYLGTDLRKDGDEPIYSQMQFDTFEKTAPFTHLDTEGDRILVRAGWDQVRRFPLATAALCLRKIPRFLFGHARHYFFPVRDVIWFAGLNPASTTMFTLAEIVLTATLVLGAAAALVLLPWSFLTGAIFAFAVYLVLLHAVVFAIPRLALPLFPFFAILAAQMFAASGRRLAKAGVATLVLAVSAFIAFGTPTTLFPERVPEKQLAYFDTKREIAPAAASATRGVKLREDGWIEVSGKHPMLEFELDPVPAQINDVVFVVFEVDRHSAHVSSAPMTLTWDTEDAQGDDKKRFRSAAFPVERSVQVLRFSPSLSPEWKGRITRLRLQLAPGTDAGRYRLREIRIAK